MRGCASTHIQNIIPTNDSRAFGDAPILELRFLFFFFWYLLSNDTLLWYFLNPPHFAHKTRPRRFAGRAELCRVPGQPVNDRVVPQVDQPCIARKPPQISAGLRHSTYRRGTEVSLLLRSITLQPLERSVMCNTPFSSGSDNSGSFPVVPVQNGIGTGILNGRTKKPCRLELVDCHKLQ